MTEILISEETAQNQIDQLFEYYGCDLKNLPGDQQELLVNPVNRIRSALMVGRLVFEFGDQLAIIQRLEGEYKKTPDKQIKYAEVTARARRAIPDPGGSANHYSRMYALLQAISGMSHSQFDEMRRGDLALAESLAALFFLF